MTAEAKTDAERRPPQTTPGEDGATVKAPPKQRPKMSLEQQSDFLSDLLQRCKMVGPELRGHYAGQALLSLTDDDMLRLETIQQTLFIFNMHNAADLVKRAMWNKRQGGARG